MKTNTILLSIYLCCLCSFCLAATDIDDGNAVSDQPQDTIRQKLIINRNMASQFESDYLQLKKEDAKNPSTFLKKKIVGVEYKLKALHEDSERLRSMLPEKQKAHEYMKDLLQNEILKQRMSKADILASEYRSYPKRSAKLPDATQVRPRRSRIDTLLSKTKALHDKALALVADKNYKEAQKIYEEILLQDPEDDQAYIILGHICLLSGEYEKAEESFHNAIHIDPINRNEITPFYQNMIVQDPNDDYAYANLGFAYIMLDEIPNAKQAFFDALAINPDNPQARRGLGIISSL